MVQVLVHHAREVLVSYHVSLLAQPSDIDLCAQVSVGNDISDSELNNLQFKNIEGFCDIFGSFHCNRLSIDLIRRSDNDHPS